MGLEEVVDGGVVAAGTEELDCREGMVVGNSFAVVDGFGGHCPEGSRLKGNSHLSVVDDFDARRRNEGRCLLG